MLKCLRSEKRLEKGLDLKQAVVLHGSRSHTAISKLSFPNRVDLSSVLQLIAKSISKDS